MDGVDLIANINRERLAFRVLVITTRRDELVRSHLRPGRVNGFFDSELDGPGGLPEVIRQIAAGGTYFSPNRLTKATHQTVDQMLTPHQIRILGVLCTAGDEKTAASILGLSEHTLHGHAQRIKRKLGVHKLSTLILEAVRRGVIRVTTDDVLLPGTDGQNYAGNENG